MSSASVSEDDFDLIEQAYAYKSSGSYPEGCTANQKRSIRRKASMMILRNGEIFLKRKEKGKPVVCCFIKAITIAFNKVNVHEISPELGSLVTFKK